MLLNNGIKFNRFNYQYKNLLALFMRLNVPDIQYSKNDDNAVRDDQHDASFFRKNKLIADSKNGNPGVNHATNAVFIEFFFAFER